MDRYEITKLYEEGVTLGEMFSQDDEISGADILRYLVRENLIPEERRYIHDINKDIPDFSQRLKQIGVVDYRCIRDVSFMDWCRYYNTSLEDALRQIEEGGDNNVLRQKFLSDLHEDVLYKESVSRRERLLNGKNDAKTVELELEQYGPPISETINLLRQFNHPDGPSTVFSGKKDSVSFLFYSRTSGPACHKAFHQLFYQLRGLASPKNRSRGENAVGGVETHQYSGKRTDVEIVLSCEVNINELDRIVQEWADRNNDIFEDLSYISTIKILSKCIRRGSIPEIYKLQLTEKHRS